MYIMDPQCQQPLEVTLGNFGDVSLSWVQRYVGVNGWLNCVADRD